MLDSSAFVLFDIFQSWAQRPHTHVYLLEHVRIVLQHPIHRVIARSHHAVWGLIITALLGLPSQEPSQIRVFLNKSLHDVVTLRLLSKCAILPLRNLIVRWEEAGDSLDGPDHFAMLAYRWRVGIRLILITCHYFVGHLKKLTHYLAILVSTTWNITRLVW